MREAGFNRSAGLPGLRVSDRGKADANAGRAARQRPSARGPNPSSCGGSPFLVGLLLVPVLLLADYPAHYRVLSPGLDGAQDLIRSGSRWNVASCPRATRISTRGTFGSIDIDQSFFQRLLGVGDLTISTAATVDAAEQLSSIPDPRAVRDLILAQRGSG